MVTATRQELPKETAGTPAEALMERFARTTAAVYSADELRQRLAEGRPLRIKYGVDVTAPSLHLGHAVNLWMMRQLQDLGHKVQFLIGDFTTRIGDPTGRDARRPLIPEAEIAANAEAFIDQARMVLRFDDPQLIEVRRNSEWYAGMTAAELMQRLALMTHARLISRDMFQDRLRAGADIGLDELIYPILQGYDSVALQSDLTIIGTDQLFNEMLGRFYQERFGQRPQVIITTKITPGIDGKAKQSKSLGNYIGLGHSPRDKFGRTMRLPDHLIPEYFTVYTEVPLAQIAELETRLATDPMGCKLELARAIVERYHGAQVAEREREWWLRAFSGRRAPADIPELPIDLSAPPAPDASGAPTALALLRRYFGTQKSNAELRRLLQQGAVTQNGTAISRAEQVLDLADGDVFRIGKRTWFRIRLRT
jgi:tyrosyl-tRNA synthetase